MPAGYCPVCGSRLFPVDEKPMRLVKACSSCVTYNKARRDDYDAALAEERAKSQNASRRRRS